MPRHEQSEHCERLKALAFRFLAPALGAAATLAARKAHERATVSDRQLRHRHVEARVREATWGTSEKKPEDESRLIENRGGSPRGGECGLGATDAARAGGSRSTPRRAPRRSR